MRIVGVAGVCPVREDTQLLAEIAAGLRPARALDLGTGTGYVAVHLALAGASVDAVDVSERALSVARRNARRNAVAVNVFRSDLFEQTHGRYDVIASNPPVRVRESHPWRVLSGFVRASPRVLNAVLRLTQRSIERRRRAFLRELAAGALRHLAPDGHLVVVLGRRETDALRESFAELELVERRAVAPIRGYEVAVFRRA